MTLLKIAQIGAPILREKARELSLDHLRSQSCQKFIDDLIATMRDASGAGLAANQVFQSIRVCTIEVRDNPRYPYKPPVPLTILVNPQLTPISEQHFDNYEGCLSVPNLRGKVQRWAEIRVQALDRSGNSIDTVVRGITAGTYQHEVDHLDGNLFIDKVTDHSSLCTWDNFSRYYEPEFRNHVAAIVKRFGS